MIQIVALFQVFFLSVIRTCFLFWCDSFVVTFLFFTRLFFVLYLSQFFFRAANFFFRAFFYFALTFLFSCGVFVLPWLFYAVTLFILLWLFCFVVISVRHHRKQTQSKKILTHYLCFIYRDVTEKLKLGRTSYQLCKHPYERWLYHSLAHQHSLTLLMLKIN